MKRPKRKAIPLHVKGIVLGRQGYDCAQCRAPLGTSPIQYDHRPPLWTRPYNTKDYVPGQLDPDYIEALHVACHDKRTNGPGGEKRITSAGSDAGTRAKVKRILKRANEPDKVRTWPYGFSGLGWASRPIQSRPFPKQHRPMRGRQ